MARQLHQWFTTRVARSAQLAFWGSLLLIPAAAITAFVTYWIAWLFVLAGIGVLFDLSYVAVHIISASFLIVLFVWNFSQRGDVEETFRIAGDTGDELHVPIPALAGSGWILMMYPGVAGNLIRLLSLLFLTAPRMICLAELLYQRSKRLSKLDIVAASEMVSYLVKAQGRVPLSDLAHRCPQAELVDTIRGLCDVDGIVFLNRDVPALTLAPRFTEEFQEWATKSEPSQESEDGFPESF